MKKLLLSVFVAFAAMMSASAQYASTPEVFASNPDRVVPGLKYKDIKKLYNPKNYVYLADPEYGTGRAWLNLLIPGLAQYTMGEGGLGTRYLLLGLLGEGAFTLGVWAYGYNERNQINDDPTPPYLVGGGAAIMIANYIFSISNAKKVARIKSQYYYDIKKLGRQVSFETRPFIAPVRVGDKVQPAAGVTFSMQF